MSTLLDTVGTLKIVYSGFTDKKEFQKIIPTHKTKIFLKVKISLGRQNASDGQWQVVQ